MEKPVKAGTVKGIFTTAPHSSHDESSADRLQSPGHSSHCTSSTLPGSDEHSTATVHSCRRHVWPAARGGVSVCADSNVKSAPSRSTCTAAVRPSF